MGEAAEEANRAGPEMIWAVPQQEWYINLLTKSEQAFNPETPITQHVNGFRIVYDNIVLFIGNYAFRSQWRS